MNRPMAPNIPPAIMMRFWPSSRSSCGTLTE
jgi:hypothetical protein